MGAPMAGHLLARGHRVVVHSRTESKAQQLIERGAVWADSASDAAAQSDVTLLCVPDTPDVEEVLFGERGVVHGAKPRTIVVDHSTISPLATRDFAKRLQRNGVTLLDAPVSGGDVGAKNGTLSIMVGGDSEAFEKAKPILQAYGKTITHCGESGAGQFMKLVNQIFVSVNLVGVAEGLRFAEAAGIDAETALEVASGGAGASWQLANLGPKIAQRDYTPGFMIDLLVKDLRILQQTAQQIGAPLNVSSLVAEIFDRAKQNGFGRSGTPAVFEMVEEETKRRRDEETK
jgi:3-hydroxyisobutyrate dehydrogenase